MEALNKPVYPDFRPDNYIDKLSGILDAEVTPESINNVADKALNELILLINTVIESYNHQPTILYQNKLQIEKSAFSYFGLTNIEDILDEIQDKVELLNKIDNLICYELTPKNQVYVPPQNIGKTIEQGSGNFEPKMLIPRLKTLIYVLTAELEIPIASILINKGTNNGTMMRKESYVLVEAPDINRAILVCDEEDNASYVFDIKVLNGFNIDPKDLVELTKPDLSDLLNEQPAIGIRINYSKNWASNILSLLTEDIANCNSKSIASNNKAIKIGQKYQKAPEDVLSIRGMAGEWDVAPQTIKNAIEALGNKLGEVGLYKFGQKTAKGYTKDQQALIYAELESTGVFTDKAPADVLSISGMASEWHMDKITIIKVIDALGNKLGEVGQYKFGTNTAKGYTKDQQALIYAELEIMGIFADKAPEDVLTIAGMAGEWDVADQTIKKAIEALGNKLGEVGQYKFGTNTANGYTKDQQAMIYAKLEIMSVFADKAPDGVLCINGMSSEWDVANSSIKKAIEVLGDKLGEVGQYKFRQTTTNGYTKEQQAMIYAELASTGVFADKAPEDVLSIRGMASEWGVSEITIKKAIEALGNKLGEVGQYKFGPTTANGYTKEQQAMIYAELASTGVFADKAPDGVLSILGMADEWDVGFNTIKKTIEILGNKLGEVGQYKFGPTTAKGYTKDQQALIYAELESMGVFADKAPNGVLSIYGMASKWGVSKITIKKAIEALGNKLGEVGLYKFGPTTADGYTKDQQALIYAELEIMGIFADKAPEDVLTIAGMAGEWHMDKKTIIKVIDALGNKLGEVGRYKFGPNTADGYTKDQQALIYAELESKGIFADKAPEDVLSIKGMAKEWNVTEKTIKKAIEVLGNKLGEVGQYKFGYTTADGYIKDQQALIYNYITKP